jgi:ribosome recycling factor
MKAPPRKTYPNTVEEQRREMVRVARGIIDGSVGIVAGARQLLALRFPSQPREKDEDMLVFCRINSETGELPIGDVRRHWNPDILKVKDEELENYEARFREQAIQAAKNLITKYTKLA